MSDLFPITLPEMINEIKREIAMRERMYPTWVRAKTLASDKADRQLAIARAILKNLEAQRPA
jgi:hypothetical protein